MRRKLCEQAVNPSSTCADTIIIIRNVLILCIVLLNKVFQVCSLSSIDNHRCFTTEKPYIRSVKIFDYLSGSASSRKPYFTTGPLCPSSALQNTHLSRVILLLLLLLFYGLAVQRRLVYISSKTVRRPLYASRTA